MPKTRSDRYKKKTTTTKKVKKDNTPKKEVKQKKKRKIKVKSVIVLLLLILLIVSVSYSLSLIKITNIYIEGNELVSEEEILKQSGLINYPTIFTLNSEIKNKLLQNELINDVTIKKENTSIYLTIKENYPLYYYENDQKTVLLNGNTSTIIYSAPNLINYVPDTIYPNFVKAMQKVDYKIILRMSEIKYDPDNVDDSRFLITMNDGNYVYLTITKWQNINDYINIIKAFPNKKGILYLNAGNSFEVKEEY